MNGQRDLPIGDQDEAGEVPRRGEPLSEFVVRIAGQDYTPAPAAPARACGCKERGWVEQHGPSGEERIDAIFKRREPGAEG